MDYDSRRTVDRFLDRGSTPLYSMHKRVTHSVALFVYGAGGNFQEKSMGKRRKYNSYPKSFAISDNRSICPIDNGELVDISISVNIWTKMSEEEKQRIRDSITRRSNYGHKSFPKKTGKKGFFIFLTFIENRADLA